MVRHNRRFAIPAQDPQPVWRKRPRELEELFCFKFHRVVALDHTVRFAGQLIDIPRPGPRSLARARVEVQQRFDGTLRIFHEGRCLATAQSTAAAGPLRLTTKTRPATLPQPDRVHPAVPRPQRQAGPWKPAPNHPWRTKQRQPG